MRSGTRGFQHLAHRREISRLGVPVPGDSSQTVYVWFDALANYISSLEWAAGSSIYEEYWKEAHVVHVIGKDIVRQHAVYWPAILRSAGLPIPNTIFVHGFLTVGGRRISKSSGNIVDPFELASSYGREALRYFLLGKADATQDRDFSLEAFVAAHDSDLADQLGNLVSRVGGLAQRRFGEKFVPSHSFEGSDLELICAADTLVARLDRARAELSPYDALGAIWDLIRLANRYVVTKQPWAQDDQGAARTITLLGELLRVVGESLRPFLPDTGESIVRAVGIEPAHPSDWPASLRFGSGKPISFKNRGILFPKRLIRNIR